MFKHVRAHYPLVLFLIAYLVISLLTYKDFGITADEELEYGMGSNFINFFIDPAKYSQYDVLLNKPYLKYYYHLYPMVLSVFNPLAHYEKFHLLNILFALPIFICAYVLLYYEYKNIYIAICGPLSILLMPAFVGHIPTNPKDIPFAVMYFMCISLVYIFHKHRSVHHLSFLAYVLSGLVIGIALGYTQSLRVVGYSVYIIYIVSTLILMPAAERVKDYIYSGIVLLVCITVISHIFMYLTFPIVRENILNIGELFQSSKHFNAWDGQIEYLGSMVDTAHRPWHYLFVYILISTPVFILLTHFASFFLVKRNNLIKVFLFAIYFNFLVYLFFHPVIYNGLRHFLYLLPLIAFTSIVFMIECVRRYPKTAIIYMTLAIFVILQSVKLHPYQYIYFNPISHKIWEVQDTFETDYWGTSYKEATQKLILYIKQNHVDTPIVYACNVDYAVRYYSEYTFELASTRKTADFIICDYQNDKQMGNQDFEIVDTVEVAGMPLNVIRQTSVPLKYKLYNSD